MPTPIPDNEFEHVIAERYLFGLFSRISKMHDRLLHYHIIILKLLTQSIDKVEETDSETLTLHMSWMSLSANGTLIVLSEIDVKSYTNHSFFFCSSKYN
jgi:hypothetical protein